MGNTQFWKWLHLERDEEQYDRLRQGKQQNLANIFCNVLFLKNKQNI